MIKPAFAADELPCATGSKVAAAVGLLAVWAGVVIIGMSIVGYPTVSVGTGVSVTFGLQALIIKPVIRITTRYSEIGLAKT